MALQVVSPKVAVSKVLGVKDGVEQTEEQIFLRGELLPDWVSPFQQYVLTQTGMARQVGDFPDPNLHRPEEEPAPVTKQEHDPRAVEGTRVVGPKRVVVQGVEEDAGSPAGGELPDLPDETATKPVWEDYAVRNLAMTRNSVESMKKADLVAAVRGRYDAAKATSATADLPPDAVTADATLPRKFGK